jgi:hypothetical protein
MRDHLTRNVRRVERRTVVVIVTALLIPMAATLLLRGAPFQQTVVINFENLAAGDRLTTQFGGDGIVFENGVVGNDLGARSGTRALRSVPIASEVFSPVPVNMSFPNPARRIRRVSFFANSPGQAQRGTLQAFGPSGNLLSQDGPKMVAANAFTTRFEVRGNNTPIARAVFRLENSITYAIDDIELEGSTGGPPPPPPQVVITQPPNGAELDTDVFTIEGTVTGQGLLTSVNARIEFMQRPELGLGVHSNVLPLNGSGTTRNFTLPDGFGGAPLGPIKVIVTAENFAGLKGSATSTFNNMPQRIRQRAAAEGPALGPFSFGILGDCKTAVYQNAAITVNGIQTFMIKGEIFKKWLANRDRLGCPTAEQRNRRTFQFEGSNWCIFVSGTEGPCEAPDVPGVVQEFVGGRIYNTNGIGTFYVPTVFVDAIEKRGGEPATGVPLADPISSAGIMKTWLFQRFFVPELPKRLPSTLEIRGTPPRLYLERQSGYLNDPVTKLPVETTATIWEHFSCGPDRNLGPCDVDPTPDQPPPIPDTGTKFCQGKTLVDTFKTGVGPRAWEPVLGRLPLSQLSLPPGLRAIDPGNYIATPLFGVVTMGKGADEDLSLVHEWCYSSIAWEPFDWATVPIAAPRAVACKSDWLVRVRPYGAHQGTAPFGGLYGGTSDNTTVKVEYERFYHIDWFDLPLKRDLIFTTGRWVIDCEHDNFKTELHPIFMYSKMRTVTSLIAPFTGILKPNPFGGTPENPVPATQADIWVTGWYPGDPIEFDVYPPPRPHPDATLVVNKPIDSEAAEGLSIESRLEPGGIAMRAHIRFTAPLSKPIVTFLGEMKWQTGRGYAGQWYVHWK